MHDRVGLPPASAEALVAYQERLKRISDTGRDIGDSITGRAISIVEVIAASDKPLAAADIAGKLGLSNATTHRLATVLERLDCLQRQPGTRRFVAGPRLEAIALEILMHSTRRGERHAILQALVGEIEETCNITVLDGNEVVYIDRVESHWPLRTHLRPGSRIPIHCGASGKLFLSLMPARRRRRLLRAAPLKKYTPKTVIDPELIEEELKSVRAKKFGLDVEEFLPGLIGLAVPVFDSARRICATVAVHAPTARHTVEQVLTQIPALRRTAAAIERTFEA